MPQTFKGAINFPTNFDVQTTAPLDPRLVVDSKDDLTNGSITAPYQGMVVNIAGTSELWILLTKGIKESKDINNWKLVTGSGTGSDIDPEILSNLTSLINANKNNIDKIFELFGLIGDSDSDSEISEDASQILSNLVDKINEIYDKSSANREDIDKIFELFGLIGDSDTGDTEDASQILSNLVDKINEIYDKSSTNEENINKIFELIGLIGDSDSDFIIGDLIDLIENLNDAISENENEIEKLNKEIEILKKNGVNSSFDYSIPVMTPEMAHRATIDPDIDFDGSEDPYIMTDFDMGSLSGETSTNTITSVNGTYLDIMMRAIRDLQSEVARLKNSFDYGFDSYQNMHTAKSNVLEDYSDVTGREPLWSIDTIGLSKVEDSVSFNTYLDANHSFVPVGGTESNIVVSPNGQLTFNNCKGVFSDGDKDGNNLTLYNQKDSKQVIYLVTDKPTISMTVVSMDSVEITKTIDFEPYLNSNSVNKYGFCIVISRQVEDSKTKVRKGFNYIYFSIINYENDVKLLDGYWIPDSNILSEDRYNLDVRYSVRSFTFDRLTLSRMKFYTKYEDFSETVLPSSPNESDWKYDVAHITIRAVDNSTILENVKNQLRENELVWNKQSGTLHIKSNGKIHLIGSNKTNQDNNNNDNMTDREIISALQKMGIIVNVEYKKDANGDDTDEILSLDKLSLSPISDFTFVNNESGKKFTYTVDSEGNLVGRDNSAETIEEFNKRVTTKLNSESDSVVKYDGTTANYEAVRGFISDYLYRLSNIRLLKDGANKAADAGKMSDRLRFSSFYAPISTDKSHGCTHSFVELENTSDVDIPLTGMYLHFYNPVAVHNTTNDTYSGKVYHLALDGVIPAGGTYLIRGAKHAEFDDASAFIKVKTFDKEWFVDHQPLSFEQMLVKTTEGKDSNGKTIKVCADDSKIKTAYRFCLTYGCENLTADKALVKLADNERTIDGVSYPKGASDYPNSILDPRFIDSCSFSTLLSVASQTTENPWYINGSGGIGIEIVENSMFRLMFALDPAKQAYNGFNGKDGSRVRYNKATDLQILALDKEYIGFPHSNEIIKIDRFTPKASFEHRNVMTDKTQLDFEKPNMVTCSFGNDVYNTRCFNWISCGVFDEYVWVRKRGETSWNKFSSYTEVTSDTAEATSTIHRKEYSAFVNNAVYARIIDRFPGNDVLFTSHKCVLVLPEETGSPAVYEYVVGRADKDGNPDMNHTNEIYTFTIYPRTYEGRVYQITDQQGFHWIEYQVWAASAEFLNKKIESECAGKNVFPILINTGDMTQSGARINEWLDYYNGGKSLFNHMEQINCVGNNDLCDTNPRELGTGNDNNKSNSRFFHYFYCFDVKDTNRCDAVDDDKKKYFNGETLVVKKNNNTTEDKYIPSFYYIKTNNVMYVIVNSEIPEKGVTGWFGLKNASGDGINIYTGIEMKTNGNYDVTTCPFTPLYDTMYAWLKDNNDNGKKKVVVAMHEMPFTVITNDSLTNAAPDFLKSTRNHPNGKASRVGSNVNQLVLAENRGVYWMSRLLEYFGCKLVIGGHKHTYALSYPVKEKYSWTYEGVTKDSLAEIKPMLPTLEDEAGENPTYLIDWIMSYDEGNPYSINIDKITDVANRKLNSTKTPYIPESLYNKFGSSTFAGASGVIRCCTPTDWNDDTTSDKKYDGYITYSMCQATGYKLKSNKELPSPLQLFSKIIPLTNVTESKPDGAQLYPMYSVLEFNTDCSEVDVKMVRIKGVFKTANKDEFGQNIYGTGALTDEYLCTDAAEGKKPMYGSWVDGSKITSDNIYLHIKF